jgi:uncharacterized protein (TIGR02246 family)
MRLIAAIALSIVVMTGCSPSPSVTTLSAEEARAGIDAMWAAQAETGLAGDVSHVGAIFTQDAVLLPAGGLPVEGRDAIVELTGLFASQTPTTAMNVDPQELFAHGDTAYEIGSFSETYTAADGEPYTREGRYMAMIVLEGDGKWRVARVLVQAN